MSDHATCVGTSQRGDERVVAVSAPRVLDPASGRTLSDVLVTVRGERIESVTEGASDHLAAARRASGEASGVTIALPSSWTALPGLIDSHTHLLLQPQDVLVSPVLYKSQAFRTIEGVAAARRTVEAGFTTVRDMDTEGAGLADVALRDAIDRAIVPGPRMFVAGEALTITAGFMNSLGFSPDITLPDLGVCTDSVPAMIAAVRRNVKYGVNLIKIYATGSLPQVSADFDVLWQFSVDEVKAVVAEAARWNKDVAAHAYGGRGARNAIEGGVRSIEHGQLLDDAIIELMVEKGVFWCPTLFLYYAEPGLERFGEAFMNDIRARHKRSFQAALRAGVKITFGTDAGGFDAGRNAREFKVMVDFGMTPLDAIRSATIRGAELLRKESDLGVIAPHRFADLIAVDGDPLKDITTLERVKFVMKGGVVVKQQE